MLNVEKVKERTATHKQTIAAAVAFLLLIAVSIFLFRGCGKTEKVTIEPQEQAQTESGVEKAADKSKTLVNRQQAQDAAKEIHYIYSHDVKPEYTAVTTGGETEKAIENAQERAGADFSIVTDRDNPSEKIDVTELPKASTVNINQYNVHAYKKILHTIDVAPDMTCVKGASEVGYTVSRKITKDGKYIGVGASYNIDDHKALVKLSYTW